MKENNTFRQGYDIPIDQIIDDNNWWDNNNQTKPLAWYWEIKEREQLEVMKVKDIHEAAIKLGYLKEKPWSNEIKVLCPDPEHDDKNPSCSLWRSINGFKCWSCGSSGKISKFIRLAKKKKLIKNKITTK